MGNVARRMGLLSVAATLAVGGLVSSTTGAASAGPRLATATVVSHATTKAHALTTPGMKKIQSVALTAGTWSIFAKATALGGNDFFRCQLLSSASATPLDGSTTQLNAAVTGDVITNVAVLKTTTNVTVTQDCGHDGDAGDPGSIDAGAAVVAFLAKPSRVRVARTSTQTPLAGGVMTGVENLSLPKGAWVIVAKTPIVDLSDNETDVYCALQLDTGERFVGSNSGVHLVSTVFQVDATAMLTTTTTFTLSCESTSGGGAYLDPGVVMWAWKATDLASTTSSSDNACPLLLTGTTANDALVLAQRSCSIGVGSYPSQITGVHLHAGTWVALAGYDQVRPNPATTLRCELLDANNGKQLDNAAASFSGSALGGFAVGITNVGAVTVKNAVDVEGRCGQDGATTNALSQSSGWAFIRP